MSTFDTTTRWRVITCCWEGCRIQFAMAQDAYRALQASHERFFCLNGHGQSFIGASDAEKLAAAEARELALRDQLDAAGAEAERIRHALLRDRQRFANGVCPCCNRSFTDVRRHMATKHPDYDHTRVTPRIVRFRCSCGRDFPTQHGLAVHQGKSRRAGWAKPDEYAWRAHLTKV